MSDMYPTHQARKKIDPISENIQTIAELHKHTERDISPPQRLIEKVTDFLGRPRFLFIILVFVSLWMVVNILLDIFRISSFDPPPFIWLQGECEQCLQTY
jgi:uncharacterized membrane protein